MTKTCSKCKEEKGLEEFHKDSRTPNGRRYQCKECHKQEGKARRAEYRKKYTTPNKSYTKKCPYCRNLLSSDNFHINRNSFDGMESYCKKCKLANKWGISREEYDFRIKSGCHICQSLSDLVIDHNHDCCGPGKSCGFCIRGTLCGRCNIMVGLAKDSPERLRAAITYLEKYQNGKIEHEN